MPKQTLRPGMVQMLVTVPKTTRDALQRIWHERGLTISQQVRHSMALWIQTQARNPGNLDARVAAWEIRDARRAHKGLQKAPEAPIDLDNDPEPDRAEHPAEWASWAARQGNRAVADLAAGHWAKPLKGEPD